MRYDFLVVPCDEDIALKRLYAAWKLESLARFIVVMGRQRFTDEILADRMKEYLSKSVKSSKIVRETKAINTVTQIFRLLPIKDKKIAIISDKEHLKWVKCVCEDMGVNAHFIDCEDVCLKIKPSC